MDLRGECNRNGLEKPESAWNTRTHTKCQALQNYLHFKSSSLHMGNASVNWNPILHCRGGYEFNSCSICVLKYSERGTSILLTVQSCAKFRIIGSLSIHEGF